jgi:hypothetical protein
VALCREADGEEAGTWKWAMTEENLKGCKVI